MPRKDIQSRRASHCGQEYHTRLYECVQTFIKYECGTRRQRVAAPPVARILRAQLQEVSRRPLDLGAEGRHTRWPSGGEGCRGAAASRPAYGHVGSLAQVPSHARSKDRDVPADDCDLVTRQVRHIVYRKALALRRIDAQPEVVGASRDEPVDERSDRSTVVHAVRMGGDRGGKDERNQTLSSPNVEEHRNESRQDLHVARLLQTKQGGDDCPSNSEPVGLDEGVGGTGVTFLKVVAT